MIRNRYIVLTAALIMVGAAAAVLLFRDPFSQRALNTPQWLDSSSDQTNDQSLNTNSESVIRPTSFVIKEAVATSCDSVSLSWQSIDDVSVVYDILRAEGPSFTPRSVASVAQKDISRCGSSFCSFTDRSVLPRIEYEYSVRARGSNWTSMNALRGCVPEGSQICPIEVHTTECIMGILRVEEATCSSVRLDWNSLPETSSYRVYRTTGDQKEFEKIAEVNSPQFEDRDVVADQEYEYSISPVYVWGEEGKRSKLISVTTSCPERKWEER